MSAQSTSTSTSTQDLNQDRIVIPLSTDERCWFKCRQSNAGRLRGQEPMCSIFCYYSNQLPSLIKDPTSVLQSTHTTSISSSFTPDHQKPQHETETQDLEFNENGESLDSRWDELIRKYTFSSLVGKYLYFATGKPAITRHLSSMSRLGSIEHDWLVQKFKQDQLRDQQQELLQDPPDKSKHLPRKQTPDKSYRGVMVLAYPKDYENVINIAHSIAIGFASVHAHFEKLYGPGYKVISRIPQSIRELREDSNKVPSQFAMIHNLLNRSLVSDSFNLLNRSFESVSEVMSRLATKYATSLDIDKNDKPSDRRFGPGGQSNKPPPSS